ncbi:MAG TPA: type II toxin-antitoxin system prevent-host-death family antitoxin [Alphaproteobacteria bacterium]
MEINVYAAKTQLSRLIDKAAEGEEVVITRHGKPVAKLVATQPRAAKKLRRIGGLKGKVWIADDFNAPLPDDILAAFEGRDEKSE